MRKKDWIWEHFDFQFCYTDIGQNHRNAFDFKRFRRTMKRFLNDLKRFLNDYKQIIRTLFTKFLEMKNLCFHISIF